MLEVSTSIVADRPKRGETAPTRAQAIRDSVEIRLAANSAGPAIAEVLKENGMVLEHANWSDIYPCWLIATVGDDVIGCVQVIRSKPVGYMEFLFVKKSAPFKLRAIAIRKLLIQGFGTLRMAGCPYVAATVAQSNTKFVGVITKLNAIKAFPGDLYVKRLALQ